MPVYNPPLSLLKEAIQSVINQAYPHWELCIADDASTNPDIKTLLNDFVQADPRIKVVFRPKNGHISAASNSALELVTHSYVALLDHDDLLHPLALYFVTMHILEYPDSEIIYSDEDKITKKGRRLDPYFKPDFNYELLLGHNMVSHLGVYRTETMRKIGGFREGLEGSQDYDLLLRFIECVKPNLVHHIPLPLYHWRISRQSAAEDLNVKPYAIQAGIRALEEHLHRVSRKGVVKFSPGLSAYKIEYDIPSPEPPVSIIITDQDISENLITCINAILESTDYQNYVIQLCLPMRIKQKQNIECFGWGLKVKARYLPDEISCSYSKSMNTAASSITEDYVVLLDKMLCGFPNNWLSAMIAQAQQSDVGCIAPKLIYNNAIVYSCGVVLLPTGEARHMFTGKDQDDDGYFGWAKLTREYSALSEKCILIKRETFTKVNGMSENYQTPFYSGIDLCFRLKELGYRNTIISPIELYIQANYHYNMPSEFPPEAVDADRLTLKELWQDRVSYDTAFNPNLAVNDEGKITVDLSPKYTFPGKYR